jgi:hypothetical protein
MDLDRADPAAFSAVERATLRGLGLPRLAFRPARPRLAVPFGGIGGRTPDQVSRNAACPGPQA